MKKWLVVIAGIALGGLALADSRVWTSTQGQISSSPSPTDVGMPLIDVAGYRISVCAADGGKLTSVAVDAGTAKVDIYWYNDRTQQWMRNKDLDETLSVGNGSCGQQPCQCEVFADHDTAGSSEGAMFVEMSGGKWADAGSPPDGGWFTIRIDARVVPVRR